MPRRPDRLRHGLRVRLLAGSVVVAACSIAATAWLAVQGTSGAIEQQQGQLLATDARIYDTLLGYAATHRDWAAAGPAVHELAAQTGRRLRLATIDRRLLADSSGPPDASLPAAASAVVDPLAVDVTLQSRAPADRIDSRAVGPFALPDQERRQLRALAARLAVCLRAHH